MTQNPLATTTPPAVDLPAIKADILRWIQMNKHWKLRRNLVIDGVVKTWAAANGDYARYLDDIFYSTEYQSSRAGDMPPLFQSRTQFMALCLFRFVTETAGYVSGTNATPAMLTKIRHIFESDHPFVVFLKTWLINHSSDTRILYYTDVLALALGDPNYCAICGKIERREDGICPRCFKEDEE